MTPETVLLLIMVVVGPLIGAACGTVAGTWLGTVTYDRWGSQIDRVFFGWWDRG